MTVSLAVDLGGTKTLVALVEGRDVLDSRAVPTDRSAGPEAWLSAIAEVAEAWQGRYRGIGITVTGLVSGGLWRPLNPETLALPDIGFPLEERAEALLGRSVTLCNDAQAAAWGEYVFGAGKGRDMVFLTISTGIGAGIVFQGRLLTGRLGLAGHAGQLVDMASEADAPIEDCSSGRWIARHAGTTDARAAFEKADTRSTEAIALSARRVARLCRNVQFLLAPEVILIGGGVGLAAGYLPLLQGALSDLDDIRRPHLERAILGGDAGIIGIAALASASVEH
ncbi:ROK family protein [Flavimaricola marinus]|uniref:N-acetylmannosamine kinase n=1 Tax=Flavimaricola marinus TaxID=1819565 RepID=A0A238LHJ2_9RHOB|nr:ROK family protein [Flavimaricola marinus]SMY08874.1 N-acetylmannosamine kinase [Flavimaricola marinus]